MTNVKKSLATLSSIIAISGMMAAGSALPAYAQSNSPCAAKCQSKCGAAAQCAAAKCAAAKCAAAKCAAAKCGAAKCGAAKCAGK